MKEDKILSDKNVVQKKDNAKRLVSALVHFCDKVNRCDDSDQMKNIWPFKPVTCNVSKKIELRETSEMDLGVFALETIEKDEYIGCYIGMITHIPESYSDYAFNLSMPNSVYAVTIDSKWNGNISRFLNHSYEPNCVSTTEYHYDGCHEVGAEPIYVPGQYWQYVESKDSKGRYYYFRNDFESVWDKPPSELVRWPIKEKEEPHIVFRAERRIEKDEQLFINYGVDYWETRSKKPL